MTWVTLVAHTLDAHRTSFVRLMLSAALLVAGLTLALLPLRWLAIALPAFFATVLAFIRPQSALYLLCFAIPFGSLLEVEVSRGITIGVTEGLVFLATCVWLARTMAYRVPYNWPPLAVGLLLFVGAASLSLVNGSRIRLFRSLPLALKEILKWTEFLAVLLVVANECRSSAGYSPSAGTGRRKSQAIVSCLLLAGIGQAILGAYQFLTRSGPEFFAVGRFVRAYGTFAQPNPYGGYLGLVAPLGLALVLGGRSSITGRIKGGEPGLRDVPRWLKWLALGAFVASSIGIGMSASRGAWLAFGAAFVAVNMAHSRKSAAAFFLLISLLFSAGVLGGFRYLPVGLTQRLTSFLPFVGAGDVRSIEITDGNYASLERLAFWRAAAGMWRVRPWLGIGFGNYQVAYSLHSLPKWRLALGHAHNYYLNIAAETGLIGLLAYLVLWGTALWQTSRAARVARDSYARALALGALGILVHVSIHNVVDNLWVHNIYVHVAIVLGLVQPHLFSAKSRE